MGYTLKDLIFYDPDTHTINIPHKDEVIYFYKFKNKTVIKKFDSLKKAMYFAFEDFYIRNVFPRWILSDNERFNLRDMKKYWEKYCLLDHSFLPANFGKTNF